jgi:hypothetical protein
MYFQNARTSFNTTLRNIREAMDVDDHLFASELELTHSDWLKVLAGQKEIELTPLMRLTQKLNLSLEAFQLGDIDYLALSQTLARRSHEYPLPRKYTRHSTSRAHTALNILTSTQAIYGPMTGVRVLRRLQIDPSVFQKPENSVSPVLLCDILTELSRAGLDDRTLQNMGRNSYETNRRSRLGITFSRAKEIRALMESIIYDHIALFDENSTYQITHLSQNACTLVARLKPEAAVLRQANLHGARFSCQLRGGVIESFPKYVGQGFARAKHTRCVYRGDSECRYEIEFERVPRRALTLVH